MSTESEVKLARYKTVEKEADAFGRLIGVRRLKPSEQTRLADRAAILAALERTLKRGDKALIGNTGHRRYLKTIRDRP